MNLYLLLKHSSIKQSIFQEVQNAYELRALKLIKAVVTRWLSHGKAVQRVLDRYEALVASLDAIYLRKQLYYALETGNSCAWIEGRIDSTKGHRNHVFSGGRPTKYEHVTNNSAGSS